MYNLIVSFFQKINYLLTYLLAHFYTIKIQEQEILVAGDLNKLMLSLLRCFVQKIVRYCKICYQLAFWRFQLYVMEEKFGV